MCVIIIIIIQSIISEAYPLAYIEKFLSLCAKQSLQGPAANRWPLPVAIHLRVNWPAPAGCRGNYHLAATHICLHCLTRRQPRQHRRRELKNHSGSHPALLPPADPGHKPNAPPPGRLPIIVARGEIPASPVFFNFSVPASSHSTAAATEMKEVSNASQRQEIFFSRIKLAPLSSGCKSCKARRAICQCCRGDRFHASASLQTPELY